MPLRAWLSFWNRLKILLTLCGQKQHLYGLPLQELFFEPACLCDLVRGSLNEGNEEPKRAAEYPAETDVRHAGI